MPAKQPNDQQRQRVQSYMKYSGMAFQMGIIILLGVFAGKKLDEYFQTEPYLTVLLALLSIGAALYSTLKDLV
ncbi:MAG: AtpZ/AtpI family protein [Bacteroidota bacterium]